jgi:3-mercaptopyruvate sulfurtransferase SseA
VVDREALLDRDAVRSLLQEWRVVPPRPDATLTERTNYRRKLTNALLELARPMPTREQFEQALQECGIGSYRTIVTDAVLALLNGTAK